MGEADDSDHVCVTPDIRTQTAEDNAVACLPHQPSGGPYGPKTCLDGYVWLKRFLGTKSVLYRQPRQATADNAAASSRIAHGLIPSFFLSFNYQLAHADFGSSISFFLLIPCHPCVI